MVSKIFQIIGIFVTLTLAVGVTYSLTFTFYQPKIDDYQEQITELESKLTVANDDVYSLNDWKVMLENQLKRQTDLNKDLKSQLDTLDILYTDLETKWNVTSIAIDRLNLDKLFLEKRLNQHISVTYSFEDELTLWQDIRDVAFDVDPDLIPMIDNLIDDYRNLYIWIDSVPEGSITNEEAIILKSNGYDIWDIIHEDIRIFDAKWIDILNNDIMELEEQKRIIGDPA